MSGMELKQNLKLTQQMIMTPRLQLAIKMLALNNLELSDMLKQEIIENPIIEAEGTDAADKSGNAGTADEEAAFKGISAANEDGFKEIAEYLVNYNEQLIDLSKPGEYYKNIDKNYLENRIENSFSSGKTLYEHLMEQVMTGDFSEREIMLSRYIAGNLDSRGFLAASLKDLEDFVSANMAEKDSASVQEVKGLVSSVLHKIGRLEPAGLGAEDVVSSLLIQADCRYEGDGLLKDIIKNHLKDVAGKNYSKIAKETGKSVNEVACSVERLKKLNPNPAANFSKEEPRYITPDLFLKKENGRYIVFMDDSHIPQIKINSYYKKILSGEIEAERDMKSYAEDRFKSAMWLIKIIDTRKETILNIAQKIVDRQAEFFDEGKGSLRPLILKDIASELGIHESTVSRATSNKYLSTHLGVFELKNFFTGASYGEASSESVMKKIKAVIDSENSSGNVFNDSEIADILKEQGIKIARRTIAKYREIMDIPSSSIRRRK